MASTWQRFTSLFSSAAPAEPVPDVAPTGATKELPYVRSRIELGEQGITGTGNYSGEILAESNLKLIHEKAYGQAGTRELGFWQDAYDTDEAVAKAMAFLLAPIRDAKVEVEEPDKKLNKFAREQTEFLRWSIENVEPGWSEFTMQAAGGSVLSGFAIAEDIWEQVEHPSLPGGRGLGIIKLAERLPSSIHANGWLLDKKGRLEKVRQLGPLGNEWKQVELPASKLELFTWGRRGDNFEGKSAFRSVYYPILIRRELARLIAVGQVRESAGIPVAMSEKDAADLSPQQLKSLQKFMANLVGHENANIVMPRGWKMEWIFAPTASRSNLIETFNALGLLILQQVGAQQLVLGTGSTGSRSVGEVHSAEARNIRNGVYSMLELVLNGVPNRPYTGWGRKLIDANWGRQVVYPRIKFAPQLPELPPKELFEAIESATRSRLITIRPSDENAARERIGMAAVDKEEDENDEKTDLEPVPGDDVEKNPLGEDPDQPAAGVPSETGAPAAAGAAPGAVAAGAVKAQDTALNGAQITSGQALVVAAAQKDLPTETVKWMLVELLRLPEESADKILKPLATFTAPKPPPAPMPFGAGPPGAKPPIQTSGQTDEKPAEEKAPPADFEKQPTAKASSADIFVPRRPLRASEEKIDFAGIKGLYDGARERFSDGVRPLVAKALMKALPDVKVAMSDGNASDVAELVQLDMSEVEQFVAEYVDGLRAEGYRHVAREKRHGRPLRAAAAEEEDDKDLPSPETSEEAHADAGKALAPLRKHVVRQMKNRLTSALEKEAINVLRTGGDPEDVVTGVLESTATTGAYKTDAGVVTAKAFSIGRDEFAQEYADQVASTELSALLDDPSTCAPCLRLDGQTFEFGSDEDLEHTPPLSSICDGGDNCRCIKVINFKEAA